MPYKLSSTLPQDSDSVPVQILIGKGTRRNLTAGVSSSSATIPNEDDDMVIVRATDWIWLRFGGADVVASSNADSILVPPGEGAYRVPYTATHFAAIRVGSTDAAVQLESV